MESPHHTLRILIDVADEFVPRARYVFEHLCKVIGLTPDIHLRYAPAGMQVYYGPPTHLDYPVSIYHDPTAVEFFSRREVFPPARVAFHRFREEYVPFIFQEPGPIFQMGLDTVWIRKDIIASAFYFLSCWQEYAEPEPLSEERRYDYRKSLQAYWGMADVAPVDRYAEILETAVDQAFPEFGKRPRWLLEKDFAVTFTHDMDYWNFWTRDHYQETMTYNHARWSKAPIRATYKLLMHYLTKRVLRNPKRDLARLFHRETLHDVRSTTFLLTAKDSPDSRMNYFDEHQRELRALSGETDIGLHGSPRSVFDGERLQTEQQTLTTAGLEGHRFRAHRLTFDYQKSFTLLEHAGIRYDCTLGFWEQAGYRAGSSYPFYPYCLAEERPFRIMEIPLTAMDVTLLSPIAMHMRPTKAARYLNRLIARTRRHHGHLSFLWHFVTFDWVDYPFWGDIWWQLIAFTKRKNAWICSLDELYEYWKKR